MEPKIIAVDFDGTLVTNMFPDIGEPILSTIAALKREQANGAKVILWTCRHDEPLEAAVKWCAEQGIHLDAVNANLPYMIELYGESRKVGASEYWDDKAVRVPFEAVPAVFIQNGTNNTRITVSPNAVVNMTL